MNKQEKDDLCATLDSLKDAIRNDRILTQEEKIDYIPEYAANMTVDRFIPTRWELSITAKVISKNSDKIMRFRMEMDL